jgi:hypothetical protein
MNKSWELQDDQLPAVQGRRHLRCLNKPRFRQQTPLVLFIQCTLRIKDNKDNKDNKVTKDLRDTKLLVLKTYHSLGRPLFAQHTQTLVLRLLEALIQVLLEKDRLHLDGWLRATRAKIQLLHLSEVMMGPACHLALVTARVDKEHTEDSERLLIAHQPSLHPLNLNLSLNLLLNCNRQLFSHLHNHHSPFPHLSN